MRYNLYRRKKDNIYEYVECKISDTKFDDYKELWNDFNDNDYVDISDDNLAFPILVDGKLREMTREEKILLLGDSVLLQYGEYIEDNKIIKVPNPSTKYLTYNWNGESFSWQLTTTKEELMNLRKEKIIKYAEVKKEIATLEEFADEFESDDTVEMLRLQMKQLKKEINELLEVIKKM